MTGMVENGAKRFWNGYIGEKSSIKAVRAYFRNGSVYFVSAPPEK